MSANAVWVSLLMRCIPHDMTSAQLARLIENATMAETRAILVYFARVRYPELLEGR